MSSENAPRNKSFAIVAAIALAVAGAVAAFIFSGGPVANEMACSRGQAPADNQQGGGECFDTDSELPGGYTWDPRGNYEIN